LLADHPQNLVSFPRRFAAQGLAWHYKKYEKEPPPDERARYPDAEVEARERSSGL
jgi:endonuclease YncB( thermonuclease family)